MTQLTPQPDLDVNDGGSVPIANTLLYQSTTIRCRDAGNWGWWPTSWATTGTRTLLTISGASEFGSLQAFDNCILTYDGGIIHGRVELYMTATFVITTSGGSDWTIDGEDISGYFPTNLAPAMVPGHEYVLEGTMETPGVVRTIRIQNYGGSSTALAVWVI